MSAHPLEDGDAYAVQHFEEFWPHYVRMHTRRATQIAHAMATTSAAILLVAGVVAHEPVFLLLAPLVDYAISQISHRIFEKNSTLPWKNTIWHTRAELRMFRLTVTGRMASEVTSCLSGSGPAIGATPGHPPERRPRASDARRSLRTPSHKT